MGRCRPLRDRMAPSQVTLADYPARGLRNDCGIGVPLYKWYNSPMSEHRISEARGSFSTTVNRAAFGGERVVLTRHGKRIAAVVPIADLELLESLADAVDLDEARAALAQAGDERVSLDELKGQLRL